MDTESYHNRFSETKTQQKAATSSNWFDLPTPAAADLPKLYREVEALRLRKSLDPKRFYRKEEGEAKGIKGLPKQFAVSSTSLNPPARRWLLNLWAKDWYNSPVGHTIWDT